MKKLILVCITAMTLLIFTPIISLASSIYFEHMPTGSWDTDIYSEDGDADGIILGVNGEFNRFICNLEYASLFWNAPSGSLWETPEGYYADAKDAINLLIKGGYRIIDNDKLKLDANLAYSYFDIEDVLSFDGFLIGTDLTYHFSKKANLEFQIGLSLNGEAENNSGNSMDAQILTYKLGFNYLFTRFFGGSLCYRSYTHTVDINGDPEFNTTGLTTGVFFKF